MAHSLRLMRSATRTTPRPSRNARPVSSYKEPASDIDEELFRAAMNPESDVADEPLASRRPARGRSNKTGPRTGRTKRPRQGSLHPPENTFSSPLSLERSRKRRAVGKAILQRPTKSMKGGPKQSKTISNHDAYSLGVVPQWSTLPYQILLQIFQYASSPLHDEFFRPMPSADWLLKTSRICRSFSEPALTALYRSPPLVPMERAHRLRQLLMADQEAMLFQYRAKVESLQIEVSQTVAYTLNKWGLLDLHGLIHNCPRLVDLEFYHQKDISPYHQLDHNIKWTYPDALFEALTLNVDGVATKLNSWRWSSRLAGKRYPVEKLREIHLSPSFISLRKVALVNYQVPRTRKNEEDPEHQRKIAESLSVLPNLQYLILESSTIVDAVFLPLLPTNLKHLDIINCWEIMADDMAEFLSSHGSKLETLVLNHNHSLSLSFLTTLGDSCPRLKSLTMNLTYYNIHTSYHDYEPIYKELLSEGEIPQWPSSLENIELSHLRKWDVDKAKAFLQSLLGSAISLPNLRRLIIKAIINTSWRERSTFRDTWVGAFERVFKRPLTLPDPHLRSIGAFEESKKQTKNEIEKPFEGGRDDIRPLRRDRQTIKRYNFDDTDDEQSSNGKSPSKRRTRRITRLASNLSSPSRSKSGYTKRTETRELATLRVPARFDAPQNTESTADSSPEPKTPSDGNFTADSDDEPLIRRARHSRKAENKPRPEEFVQGMCDFVFVRIDNLRPAETQFREADFLDSEPEGDSEWDENDDGVAEAGYAW